MPRQRIRLDDDNLKPVIVGLGGDNPKHANGSLSADMLLGVESIAHFLRGDASAESCKWVYRIGARKILPIGKAGGRLIASRTALTRAYEQLTGAAE
jgi:hypothetical protein